MSVQQRRNKILDLLREDGHAKVQDLSRIFGVSEVTIRLDLEALEATGEVQREHGGAFLTGVGSFAKTGKMINRANTDLKKEIARKAAELIADGDCIILDSGSTTTEIAHLLVNRRELTVVTNALNIALILGENPGISIVMTGGEFKAPTLSLTGKLAADSLKNFHVSKLFLATAGISPSMQLTYPGLSDLEVKNAMIQVADEVYLVADSTKIGISAMACLGPFSMVDTIITDSQITPEQIQLISESGVKVM
ncbi:MAG: DeoR/GlpR family DNA-binding transcription regulator [Duncaniella sp.]|nr:DeoR/GlpR family DNA-binding transcription regulator [Duncaniella sp.]MDE6327997.1 DeoR/GlpR family DNA-binding transcription regulator [Duncaniella sp.]MDE6572154.1 DeoR/GlpR family DNA-binding transcription regulator [Duncaniella sp.]